MHLQEGVGRAGFRLLVFVFFLIGVGGIALAWAASTVDVPMFLNIGLVTALAGMALLLVSAFAGSISGLVDILPSFESRENERVDEPAPRPAKDPAVEVSRPSIDYEFPDVQPAAPAAPEQLIVPPAFRDEKPPAAEIPVTMREARTEAPVAAPTRTAAPEARRQRDPARWPKDDGRAPEWTPPRPKVDAAGPEARREMRERYTANTPMLRSAMGGREAPEPAKRLPPTDEWDDVPRIRAQRAPDDVDNDWMEDGQTVGRCGGCKTRVLAPTTRPVIIVCPACEREKLLE